jgi:hypothetical protein
MRFTCARKSQLSCVEFTTIVGKAAASCRTPNPSVDLAFMLIREYHESDLEALRAIHAKQGFDYALPDLRNPLFATKLVLAESPAPSQPCHSERSADEMPGSAASKTCTRGCRRPSPKNSAAASNTSAGFATTLGRPTASDFSWRNKFIV